MLLGPGDKLLFEETDAMIAAHLFVAGVLPMEFFEEQYNPRVLAVSQCGIHSIWSRQKNGQSGSHLARYGRLQFRGVLFQCHETS